MEKALAERAEEARVEKEKERDNYYKNLTERCNKRAIEDLKVSFPEAIPIGNGKFEVDGEIFDSTYDGVYERYQLIKWDSGRAFHDLAGYGEYLKNKRPKFPPNETEGCRPVRPPNITVEEKGCLASLFSIFFK